MAQKQTLDAPIILADAQSDMNNQSSWQQWEGWGSRLPKIEETWFMDVQ